MNRGPFRLAVLTPRASALFLCPSSSGSATVELPEQRDQRRASCGNCGDSSPGAPPLPARHQGRHRRAAGPGLPAPGQARLQRLDIGRRGGRVPASGVVTRSRMRGCGSYVSCRWRAVRSDALMATMMRSGRRDQSARPGPYGSSAAVMRRALETAVPARGTAGPAIPAGLEAGLDPAAPAS